MLNAGILVSGGGTNLQAILDSVSAGNLPLVKICVVISSNEKAYALERAKKHGVPALYLPRGEENYNCELIRIMDSYNVNFVVLAGFLSMLGPLFVKKFENRIINVHPSLIPSFSGKGCYGIEPHKRALARGVKLTGATVHFVDSEYDNGPILLQKAVSVMDEDTPEILQKRVMEEAEQKILPQAIKLISEGRVVVCNRKTSIINNNNNNNDNDNDNDNDT